MLCLDNTDYPASLEVGKVYRSLPTTARVPLGWLRIVDESGEDYLYPQKRFVAIEIPTRAKRVLSASK